jgi:hypothetical protein
VKKPHHSRSHLPLAAAALLLALEATAVAAGPGSDTAPAGPSNAVAVELVSLFPVGEWRDLTGVGVGALVRGDWFVHPALAITGRAGYVDHFLTTDDGTDYSTSEAPFLVGAAYFAGSGPLRFYAAGELGLVLLRGEVDSPNDSLDLTASDAKLGFSAGLGLRRERMDVRLTWFAPSVANANRVSGLLFTVGFSFLR